MPCFGRRKRAVAPHVGLLLKGITADPVDQLLKKDVDERLPQLRERFSERVPFEPDSVSMPWMSKDNDVDPLYPLELLLMALDEAEQERLLALGAAGR